MKLVIDMNILGMLCHPSSPKNKPVAQWFANALVSGEYTFFLPSIADYELRRKLLHLVGKKQAQQASIDRLDKLGNTLDFIDLEAATLKKAAAFWAHSRAKGKATAPDHSIDGDVLLAAQAHDVGGTVLTENPKHLSQFVGVKSL